MLHVRKGEKDFKYFSYTLVEQNDKIKCIIFVGGDRGKAQQGFLSPLRRCTFLPCKKHVEDDISRKIDACGLKDMKKEVLLDIFGSDKSKEKGIIDSSHEDEFVAKVDSLLEKWKSMEKGIFLEKEPRFEAYFRDHIEEDMKDGMLLSTRRKAGLKDKFFYNNAQECSNFKYKSKIKEAKVSTTPGYCPNLKCTSTEALVTYRKLVEEASRDKQRAVLQKGSFVLSERYRHLQVPLNKWSAMTLKEKQSHLTKVDASVKENPTVALSLEDDQTPSTSEARDPVSCTIGTFEDYKLPECLRGSWVNACKIVDLQGMANHPTDPTKRMITVITLSGSTTHTVKMGTQKNLCPYVCHCIRVSSVRIYYVLQNTNEPSSTLWYTWRIW